MDLVLNVRVEQTAPIMENNSMFVCLVVKIMI